MASFTDADPNGTATDYSATINWGNGTSNAGTIVYNSSLQKFTVSGTNTYATEGTFAIAVTIRDSGGATVIASSTANVPDFAVTATAVAVSATEGAAFTGTVATFTDADPNGVLADFSATIAWGDGHTSTGTISFNASTHSGTVTGTNTYAEEGTFPIAVKVHDVGGASASASPSATVADAALSSTGINFSAVAGIAFSRSVATFTDADPGGLSGDDSVSIAWGELEHVLRLRHLQLGQPRLRRQRRPHLRRGRDLHGADHDHRRRRRLDGRHRHGHGDAGRRRGHRHPG